jgi:hypothetical protein
MHRTCLVRTRIPHTGYISKIVFQWLCQRSGAHLWCPPDTSYECTCPTSLKTSPLELLPGRASDAHTGNAWWANWSSPMLLGRHSSTPVGWHPMRTGCHDARLKTPDIRDTCWCVKCLLQWHTRHIRCLLNISIGNTNSPLQKRANSQKFC